MDKAMFWLQVVVVAIAGIYIFKLIASQANVDGLSQFAQAI
jgi:hypothetical protein